MDATKVLMEEHIAIQSFLDILEAGALSLEAGEAVRPGFILGVADLLQGYTHEFHESKEERVLFPALEAAGVPKASGPVTMMLADHREARRLLSEARAGAEALEKGDATGAGTVVSNAHDYVDLMRQHIVKEDEVLFPVAGRLIPAEQQSKLVEDFDRVAIEETGLGTRERYLGLAEALAREAAGMTPGAPRQPDRAHETRQASGVNEILERRAANRVRLEREAPDLYNGFNELLKHYYKPGALERKYKELMAVTASVATRCLPCLANHANAAVAAGATRAEVLEAAAIGVEFGGGPSFVAVRDNLLNFLDEIEAGR